MASPAQRLFSDGLTLCFEPLSLRELLTAASCCRAWLHAALCVAGKDACLHDMARRSDANATSKLLGSSHASHAARLEIATASAADAVAPVEGRGSFRLRCLAASPFRHHVGELRDTLHEQRLPPPAACWRLAELRLLAALPALRRLDMMVDLDLFLHTRGEHAGEEGPLVPVDVAPLAEEESEDEDDDSGAARCQTESVLPAGVPIFSFPSSLRSLCIGFVHERAQSTHINDSQEYLQHVLWALRRSCLQLTSLALRPMQPFSWSLAPLCGLRLLTELSLCGWPNAHFNDTSLHIIRRHLSPTLHSLRLHSFSSDWSPRLPLPPPPPQPRPDASADASQRLEPPGSPECSVCQCNWGVAYVWCT
jgi:hypothetical protein